MDWRAPRGARQFTAPTHARARGIRSCRRSADPKSREEPPAIDFSVDVESEFKRGLEFGEKEIRARFSPARVSDADRGLPIADALVATSAQVFVASAALAVGWRPSWLVAVGPSALARRGVAYLPAALAHGAKLAACWTLGGLAGKAYERKAFDGTFEEAMKRTVQGGCFASALVILLAQFSMSARFAAEGLGEPVLGNSPEGDAILIRGIAELFVDIASEAVALVSWRAIRWNTSPLDPASLLPDDEDED